ncbi:MAG: ATP-binding protein [Treponema sp.]|nr:ATP-binding protein [Treponema sp.]MCL2252599.1 ATP-binding protein [Treponema sp.]
MTILNHFEKIIALAEENGLAEAFFQNAQEHLDAAGALLQTTPSQTTLFALLLNHFGEDSVSIDDLSKTLKCGKMQLIEYMEDFDVLRKKRLIRPSRNPRFMRNNSGFPSYVVPLDVIEAVRKGVEYQYQAYENLTPEDFFECAENLLKAVKSDDLSDLAFLDEVDDLLKRNKHLSFVKKSEEFDLGNGSVIILFIFITTFLHKDEEVVEMETITNIISDILGRTEARHVNSRFKSREHKLFAKGLVEFDCNNSMADTEYLRITDLARDEFLSDVNLKEKIKQKRNSNFILADNIKTKNLFFSDTMKSRIHELTTLLREENFTGIQKRLADSSMRTGFACIFSGPPGTGKTETAYQIARETGRDIMLVDIADTKSMWFGQSEKRIKAVFDRYRGAVKSTGIAPILLFNEADAVLGKRRTLCESRSGPDQTENAIQNIILQEMENLNGILIATTNMTTNLDKAFERRFLYKIEFDKPDTEAKKMMWQNFIPSLSEEDAFFLARNFDFSGGQIENITRKNLVSFILNGTAADINIIEKFCKEELMEKAAVRIGF